MIDNINIWSMNISSQKDYEEAWNKFEKNSCFSIDYFLTDNSIDYSQFEDISEIKNHLQGRVDENSMQFHIIRSFIDDINVGDLFIAHKGRSTLTAMGWVESDYIYQEGDLRNIRKINWFYIGDLYIKNSFFSSNQLVHLSDYPSGINEIICAFARINKDIQHNLLDFIFDKFYDEYHNTEQGKIHADGYFKEGENIRTNWVQIQEKYNNGENIVDDIWDKIINRDVRVFREGTGDVRAAVQGSIKYSDEDMDKIALNFFETINKLVNNMDIYEQRKILNTYLDSKFSMGFGKTGRFTSVLYYLDNSYYVINNKTVKTFRLLSQIFGDEIKLSAKLEKYIDENLFYKKFLDELGSKYNNENLRINDFEIFDEFTHWFCDKSLGYYIDEGKSRESVNNFPLSLILNDFKTEYVSSLKRNIIYFGAPGTGKSYNLNKDMKNLTTNYERVTFHPDYSYANFVGTYKPVPKGEEISYEYVPGPFMRSLVKALRTPSEPFLLIIEEINRANVAAVFGDIFQLLDRDDDNASRYPIEATEDMKTYLKSELNEDFDKITIPSNLFIWATMNSADQGVFPMDTAFKRRWDFKYFGINHNEHLVSNIKVELNNQIISWNDLRKAINEELLTYKINEDKLLGPFFAFNEYLDEDIPLDEFIETFKNKVIMYLFEDAAKSKRDKLFLGVSNERNITYSEICEAFDKYGIEIFCDNIKNKFIIEDS